MVSRDMADGEMRGLAPGINSLAIALSDVIKFTGLDVRGELAARIVGLSGRIDALGMRIGVIEEKIDQLLGSERTNTSGGR